jgi:Rrf2 family transcriptional regulator, nitric oxide-sensitive transcriptional repressor
MQLSTFTDYALRILVYAAARPDERCLTADVANAYGISRHHVVKVVNELQHLGYIETTRGRNGGFTLAESPEHIRVGDVVRRTESGTIVECFDRHTNTCPIANACGLKGALAEAFAAFLAALDRYSISDMVARPQWASMLVTLTPPRVSISRIGDHQC